MQNPSRDSTSTTKSPYAAIRPQPAHPLLGAGILIYSLLALASTPITFMAAMFGQLASPQSLGEQVIRSALLIFPISSIASGIIGIIIAISIFKRTKVPKKHYIPFIIFSIPIILFLLGAILLSVYALNYRPA